MTEHTMSPEEARNTEKLLEELCATQDFPALSHTITQINKLVQDEASHTDQLTRTVLRDTSLTNKVLRLVNTVHYSAFGGRAINTISRAVVILGFNKVRDAALSLMLFEHLSNRSQAKSLQGEALENYFCGVLGRHLAPKLAILDTEEAFIASMFRNLGRLMARFYFYERTQEVQALVDQGETEDAAVRQVFGTSYDQLGLRIAHFWQLPQAIIQGITPMTGAKVARPSNEAGKIQVVASLAKELHRAMAADMSEADRVAEIRKLSQRYHPAGDYLPDDLRKAVVRAAEDVRDDTEILQVSLANSPLLQRLTGYTGEEGEGEEAESILPAEALLGDAEDEIGQNDPIGLLTNSLQELTDALLSRAKVSDILQMVLEVYFRTGYFDRVMIAVRDRTGTQLSARVGFGKHIEAAQRAMRIPTNAAGDVFSAAAAQGVDILIADARADNIVNRIPSWHRDGIGAISFLLLPMTVDKKTLAMFYADSDKGPIRLDPKALHLIKALRNQALLAMRQ